MDFRKWSIVLASGLFFIGMIQAQDIELEMTMPGSMFGPGSPFGLDLQVTNSGPALNDAQLFVALTIGNGHFWFYPQWQQYPPVIDWVIVDVPASVSDTWEILPMFSWPSGAGTFEGAMFFAAILDNDVLMSNLAEFTFGWTEEPVPTSTPTYPAASATPTSGPDTPTPTPPPAPTGFVYIPPGTYTRGSPSDEPCRSSLEGPQHQVTLIRGFYMMTTEVTRQMWADLQAVQPTLPNDPSYTTISPTMNHPVQRNTWYEAVLFANLMSVRYGYTRCYYKDAGFTIPLDETNYRPGSFYCNFDAHGYRLPTEAEWEYACRAGTTGPFSAHEPSYSSDDCNTYPPSSPLDALNTIAWWYGNTGGWFYGTTFPVGTQLSNPWGLYDMHGNVWEWCWDWSGSYPSGSVTDPTGPSSGSHRVRRGGGWSSIAEWCRSAVRGYYDTPGYRYRSLGFRLLRSTN